MRIALALACVAGCRGGPTVVIYSGPPVSACPTGRAYSVPPADAPIVAFVPVADAAPPAADPAPPSDEPPPVKKKPPTKKKKKGSP